VLTERFDSALAFMMAKHRAQVRKGSGVPYATHLLAVSAIVGEHGGDEEQMIAGLLHDAIEDQGVTEVEISERFGPRVARIVVACTDSFETPKLPWRARKEAYLAALAHKPPDVKLVSAADKLHNATSILRDLRDPGVGSGVWNRFTAGREESLWYYRSLVGALGSGWEHALVGELERAVRALEAQGSSSTAGPSP